MKEKIGIFFLGASSDADAEDSPSATSQDKVKCLHQSGIGIYERHLHRYEREKYNV
jgi:hypothetical protein